jgi:hypothetical protein
MERGLMQVNAIAGRVIGGVAVIVLALCNTLCSSSLMFAGQVAVKAQLCIMHDAV